MWQNLSFLGRVAAEVYFLDCQGVLLLYRAVLDLISLPQGVEGFEKPWSVLKQERYYKCFLPQGRLVERGLGVRETM